MAVNQQPFSRTVTLPATNVSTGSGFTQLANATSAISEALTSRITDVAASQAAMQGERDVQDQVQPDKLALPFNKVTAAYNNAVSNTEERRIVATAEKLINESLVNNKNDATFNRNTPAKFNSEIEGIKSGVLDSARDENRERIRDALDRMTAHASLNMLQHSIEFDNRQTNFDFKKDMDGLLEARRSAAIAGDTERLAGIDAALQSSLHDYSQINAGIARLAPYYQDDILRHKAVDEVLSGYGEALQNKTTANYLADLAGNKNNLPFNVWQDAVKGVVQLDQVNKQLKNDVQAEQWAGVQYGISNGSIQDPADILNFNELSTPQTLTAMRQLETAQAKEFAAGSTLINAQQNILNGRPEFNSASTRDKMFQNQVKNFEKATGAPPNLVDMSESVLGLNQFPASGMPNTAVGTNVPSFDAVMQGKLTGGDVMATAQAALVYNDMVNVKEQPNSVNLTGDALAVATLFGTLNQGGTSPDQAAQQAINAVLNAKEPEVAARIDRFHRTLEKIDPSTGSNQLANKFKDAFGESPKAFGSDAAFKLFQDTYRANYISSNSEEAAFNATKYAMRGWGTSQYFDKGYVGQPVPEKELPITNIGHAFPNQIIANLQGLINRTQAARQANPTLNIPSIEWANPAQTIKGDESEEARVFTKFTLGNKPRIKINGRETDVVLMPSATSRLGEGVNYLFGVYDQFNNLHPLEDPTNGVDRAARFRPRELETWAPGISKSKGEETIRKAATAVRQEEKQQDLKNLERSTPSWQVIFGLASPKEHLKFIAEHKDDDARIEELASALRGRSQERAKEETNDKINAADNVGISADSGQVIPGNIDLSSRPRVKNPNGKISTVRSIGVESDGLEFVIPTVSDDGKLLSNKEAIALFKKTKKHLGAFKTRAEASAFAEQLHKSEEAKLLEQKE